MYRALWYPFLHLVMEKLIKAYKLTIKLLVLTYILINLVQEEYKSFEMKKMSKETINLKMVLKPTKH